MKKVALVTGGSSGIGEATATELVKRGWQVAIMSRKGADVPGTLSLKGDVAVDADCRRVAAEVIARWGRIDGLVNNAGTTKFVAHGDMEGLSAEDFEGIFRINLVGPWQMIRACRHALKESRGAVVNVSSIAAALGTGSSVAYAASKAALNTMTFSLARALGPEIRLNVVSPGYTQTPWQEAAHGVEGARKIGENYAAIAPLRIAPVAQDTADAIAWLLEGARAVTGEVIHVDGGLHVANPRPSR